MSKTAACARTGSFHSLKAKPRKMTEQAAAHFCSVPMLSSHSYHDRHVPLSFQAIKEKKACKRSFFSFGKLLKLVLLLLVAAVAVDIYKHKGYKGKKLFVVSLWLSLFHSGLP